MKLPDVSTSANREAGSAGTPTNPEIGKSRDSKSFESGEQQSPQTSVYADHLRTQHVEE